MEDLFQLLEIKLKKLIEAYHGERQNKQWMAQKNDELLIKQRAAVSQIKQLVSQLKQTENDHGR